MAGIRKEEMHGLRYEPIYKRWLGLRDRCNNPSNKNYHRYGGRGIKVFPEWDKFINFYNWAMANGYDKSLTLDRIDNNGNYEPSNCRWVSMKEQCINKSDTRYVVINNKKISVPEIREAFNYTKGKAEFFYKYLIGEFKPKNIDKVGIQAAKECYLNGYDKTSICEYFNKSMNSMYFHFERASKLE